LIKAIRQPEKKLISVTEMKRRKASVVQPEAQSLMDKFQAELKNAVQKRYEKAFESLEQVEAQPDVQVSKTVDLLQPVQNTIPIEITLNAEILGDVIIEGDITIGDVQSDEDVPPLIDDDEIPPLVEYFEQTLEYPKALPAIPEINQRIEMFKRFEMELEGKVDNLEGWDVNIDVSQIEEEKINSDNDEEL
jgi:hypothetical protein